MNTSATHGIYRLRTADYFNAQSITALTDIIIHSRLLKVDMFILGRPI